MGEHPHGKGLVARCHSFWFNFTFIEQTYNILYILLVENHSCYPHCIRSVEGLLQGCRAEIRTRASGLPYSKPMRYNLSHTALTGRRKSKVEVINVYISGRGWACAKFDGGGRKRSSLSILILREGGPLYCNGLIKGSPRVIKLLTTVSENRNFVP
jgi:hypothetical protein